MTALTLLIYISVALLLQLGIAISLMALRASRQKKVAGASDNQRRNTNTSEVLGEWRGFRVVRRAYEDKSETQCSYYLEPVDRVTLPGFKPGQFLTFNLEVSTGPDVAGRFRTRCYSLSDQPNTANYRVTIKRVLAPATRPDLPVGAASNYFHDHVQVGDVLQIKAPSGSFVLDSNPQVPTVLIACGIGITPMMSMLRWSLDHQPERVIHLFYGVRNGDQHAFKSQLEDNAAAHPGFHLHVAYSQPSGTDHLGRDYEHAGHIDVRFLRETLAAGLHQYYVCGPAAMMESLVPALVEWGVAASDIHFESFGPASARLPGSASQQTASALASPLEVKFKRSGRTLIWDGSESNLLDFAERHGISVESGCRSGSCGSCSTGLLSGEVKYVNPPNYEVLDRHCLLCVGTPASALVLEA